MAHPPEPDRPSTPTFTPVRLAAGLCLLVPFVAMLWQSSYAREDPRLLGFPFFYWYQLAFVFVSAAITWVAYLLVQRDDERRRADLGFDRRAERR